MDGDRVRAPVTANPQKRWRVIGNCGYGTAHDGYTGQKKLKQKQNSLVELEKKAYIEQRIRLEQGSCDGSFVELVLVAPIGRLACAQMNLKWLHRSRERPSRQKDDSKPWEVTEKKTEAVWKLCVVYRGAVVQLSLRHDNESA